MISVLRGPLVVVDASTLRARRVIYPPKGCATWTQATLSNDGSMVIAHTEPDVPQGEPVASNARLETHCALAYSTLSSRFLGRLRATTDKITVLAWHPTRGELATISCSGHMVMWGQTPVSERHEFPIGYVRVTQNLEYVEAEDEHDLIDEQMRLLVSRKALQHVDMCAVAGLNAQLMEQMVPLWRRRAKLLPSGRQATDGP